jgi:hypothetical protein
MRSLRKIAKIRQIIRATLLAFAVMCSLPAADASITFTPGHIYSTYTESSIAGDPVYRNIIEYDASGTVLGSLVIPSLVPNDELRGIAFGPDGLLYAVKVHVGIAGFTVLVLDSSGAVHRTYAMGGIYVFGTGSGGKIAVDPQYIYVAGGSDLVRFTVGDPNSGVSIYSKPEFDVLDVKILPNGHLFVSSSYQIDEITNTGTVVRTVATYNGIEFVDIQGIEYDPVTNKLFVTELGTLDATHTLLRLNASTGAIETTAFFYYAEDLFLTESRTLLVGSRFDAPRVYNENWAFVRRVGTAQRQFVTQYIDFSNDGHPDYLLYNSSTRQTMVWYLNNNVLIGTASGPTVPADWQVLGVADFNRDGHPDYVLFNSATRATVIWYMNNNVHVGSNHGPTLPGGWQVVAVADFNRDGHPDYLLFNPATRATVIWYMNNNVHVGSNHGPTPPGGWDVVAVADFNQDDYPDYVLYNANTRATVIWYMNNNVHVGSNHGPTLPAAWILAGVADFNGNGHPDYLLLNTSTHATVIWYLSGLTHTSGRTGPTIAAGYDLVGLAD